MAGKSSGIISHGRVAENRKARHDYEIIETIEAGLMLLGLRSQISAPWSSQHC